MNTRVVSSPLWTTSSFGAAADTSPMELSALGDHLHHCKGARGPLFGLKCLAEAANAFVAPRFVTTVVAVSVVIGFVSLLF